MKDIDHLSLANYLLEEHPLPPALRRAFLTGNLLPDYNIFTYVRGFRKSGRLLGHNCPYSEKNICKTLRRLSKQGIRTVFDAYSLGTAIHYLADGFTHVHTPRFSGSLFHHKQYERKLHPVFADSLNETRKDLLPPVEIRDPVAFLNWAREMYLGSPQTVKTDAKWIIFVCRILYRIIVLSENK